MSDNEYEEGGSGGFVGGLLLGAAIGAGIALLFAPESGARTRRKLGKQIRALREQAGEEVGALGDEITRRGRRARRSLSRAASAVRDELDDVI